MVAHRHQQQRFSGVGSICLVDITWCTSAQTNKIEYRTSRAKYLLELLYIGDELSRGVRESASHVDTPRGVAGVYLLHNKSLSVDCRNCIPKQKEPPDGGSFCFGICFTFYFLTSMPMLRAVPAMMRIAASIVLALRSTIFTSAISRT